MQAGPPGPRDPDELVQRLGQLVRANRAEDGSALVEALIDQLAAGQVETLYGLQSATSALRQRGAELEQTADSLKSYLATALGELVEELTTAALSTARRTVEGLREELSAEAVRTTTALTSSIEQSRVEVEHTENVVAGTLAQLTQDGEALQERLAFAADQAIGRLRAGVTERLGEALERNAELEARIVEASERAASVVRTSAETLAHGLAITADAVVARFEASAMAADARAAELEARLAEAGKRAAGELARSSDSVVHDVQIAGEGVAAITQASLAKIEETTAAVERRLAEIGEQTTNSMSASARSFSSELSRDVDAAGEGISQITKAVLAEMERTTASTEQRLTGLQSSFGADVEATGQGLTAVGENILDRLVAVLDERDRRDKLLEDRLTARVDRLTKKSADRVAEMTTVLDEHLAALQERDLTERQHVSEALQEVLERLLAEPRGKLKKLRDDAR